MMIRVFSAISLQKCMCLYIGSGFLTVTLVRRAFDVPWRCQHTQHFERINQNVINTLCRLFRMLRHSVGLGSISDYIDNIYFYIYFFGRHWYRCVCPEQYAGSDCSHCASGRWGPQCLRCPACVHGLCNSDSGTLNVTISCLDLLYACLEDYTEYSTWKNSA